VIFLSKDELRQLTGYCYGSRQILWLQRNNWTFEVNAQFRPMVARSYFMHRMMGGKDVIGSALERETQRPDFSAIGRLLRK